MDDLHLTPQQRLDRQAAAAEAEMAEADRTFLQREKAFEEAELARMRTEEERQCGNGDMFWGADFRDAELATMAMEARQMAAEEALVFAIREAKQRAEEEHARAHAEAERLRRLRERHREQMEATAMRREETLQTQIDRFWGVDVEASRLKEEAARQRRLAEQRAVKAEKARMAALHKEWARIGVERERLKRKAEAEHQAKLREDYIKSFYTAVSSAEVIGYTWPSAAVAGLESPMPEGYDMDVVLNPDRIESPVHTLHRLNPVRTAGKRRVPAVNAGTSTHFELVPDLRPTHGRGIQPVAHPAGVTYRPLKQLQELKEQEMRNGAADPMVASSGDTLWPVPTEELRKTRHVLQRGWLLPAMGKTLPDGTERIYACLWKSSVVFLFEDESNARHFFSGEKAGLRSLRGYIDLENAVAVSEKKLTPAEKRRLLQDSNPDGEAEETPKKKGGSPRRKRRAAPRRGSRASAVGADDDDNASIASRSSKASGAGDGSAEAADGSAEDKSEEDADNVPAEPRIVQVQAIGQSWLFRPDTRLARNEKRKLYKSKLKEIEDQKVMIENLEADAKMKERLSAAAEKKGPREGNYKLKMKAQSARMKVTIAEQNLVRMENAIEGLQKNAENAEEDEFLVWKGLLASGVKRRNEVVRHFNQDPELARPIEKVDVFAVQRETAELLNAVALAKLGPWSMPVDQMPNVESLLNMSKAEEASAQASAMAEHAAATAAAAKEGAKKKKSSGRLKALLGKGGGDKPADAAVSKFVKGTVNVIKGTFGFLRPDDKAGDQDIFFYLKDSFSGIAQGDRVQFDLVVDARPGQSDKDTRAVRVRRLQEAAFVQYDDLDTTIGDMNNAAIPFCTENIAIETRRDKRRRSSIFDPLAAEQADKASTLPAVRDGGRGKKGDTRGRSSGGKANGRAVGHSPITVKPRSKDSPLPAIAGPATPSSADEAPGFKPNASAKIAKRKKKRTKTPKISATATKGSRSGRRVKA